MSETQNSAAAGSDKELVLLARNGDEAALTSLIRRYAPLVRMRAHSFSQGMLDEEDLYQEGMIALLSAVRGFREEKWEAFKPFAAVCVNNKLRNAVAAHMREKNAPMRSYLSLSDTQEEAELPADPKEDPAQMVIASEESDARRQKIETLLSPFERQVLQLYLNAFPYEEMARRLASTTKAVDNALQRTRRKLRGALSEE